MRQEQVIKTLYRWGYLLAMYCGVRAVFNRIHSKMRTGGCQLDRLHGTLLRSEIIGDVFFFVHARPRPQSFSGEANFGMISIQERRTKLGPLLYRYFCLTSHFGCGQMEIAFYEMQGKVTLYALRNTAASNAFRLRWYGIAKKLLLAKRDAVVTLAVMQYLEENDFVTDFADVAECLNLSVSNRLLCPASRFRAMCAMKKKYSKLRRALRQDVA